MRQTSRNMVVAGGLFLSCLVAQPVAAQDAGASEVEGLRADLEAANARVEALEERLRQLEALVASGGLGVIPEAEQATLTGRGLAVAVQETPPPATPPSPPPDGVVEPPPLAQTADGERRTAAPSDAVETVTREVQNISGSAFSIEPGFTYTHSTSAALNLSGFLALDAIFLGRFSIDEVKSDTMTADVTARLGLFEGLQADVSVPYLFRHSTYTSGGAGSQADALSEKTITSRGLGDISAGLSYRLLSETRRRPDIVLLGRVKAPTGNDPFGIEPIEVEGSDGNLVVPSELPTGNGVWAVSGGISALKTIDPLVVFGNIAYFHNFEGEFDDISDDEGFQPGRARLGDAFQYGVGVAFALNETTSLSLGFTQRFIDETQLLFLPTEDNPEPATSFGTIVGSNSNVGLLNIGAGFSLSDDISLLFNVSAGITDDAPDMTVGVRLPTRF